MFKHGMTWSHRATVLGVVCGVLIYLFIIFLLEKIIVPSLRSQKMTSM